MRAIATALRLSAIVFAFSFMTSCGSSNNDQGTTITATGFFAASPCDVGLAGLTIPISQFLAGEGTGQEGFGGATSVAAIQILNNLAATGFRVDRLNLSYEIPGSSIQPPSTVSPLSLVIGPAPTSNTGAESSLPPGFATAGNPGCSEFILVPFPILEYLNLNRNNLPDTPFQMFVTVEASGVTTAGDRINTNPLTIFIDVVGDNPIPPTFGSEGGTVGGGTTEGISSDTDTDNDSVDGEGVEEGDDTLAQEEGGSDDSAQDSEAQVE